jgi:hypothetical protein
LLILVSIFAVFAIVSFSESTPAPGAIAYPIHAS